MFIVSTIDGKTYREGVGFKDSESNLRTFVWDDVPRDVKITRVQLTFPFKVKFKEKFFAPLLTVHGFNRYYFSNEEVQTFTLVGTEAVSTGERSLEAKIIGCIDDKAKTVMEIREDKVGNCTINKFDLKTLKDRIKAGTFREDIIRQGILRAEV